MQNKNYNFLIFGATGMQGNIVTRDLTEKGFSVAASGNTEEHLQKLKNRYSVDTFKLDLKDEHALFELVETVKPQVIVNCAEGDWNVAVYRAALNAGVHVIDLGSDIPATKDQLALHPEFEAKGLTAITGCGSTPGVNNVMLDYASQYFDQIDSIEAGFAWNSNMEVFVVPFSMESILEEFSDPASIVENGAWKDKQPMDSVTDRDFRFVGDQKVFFVRHPEPYTFYENYKSKGVRDVLYYAGFPPHSFELIKMLIPTPDQKARKVTIVPQKGEVQLNNLTRVMQELYPMPDEYTEKENLWVDIKGSNDGQPVSILMECLVPTLPDWRDAGCNIDTGLPASIMAQMVLNGEIAKRGSFAPESVVPHDKFFKALADRSMEVYVNGVQWTDNAM